MHRQLSVSAVSSLHWTLEEDLRFWAGAGIDHVGLSLRKLEEAGPTAAAAAARVRDAGLRVSNVVEVGWCSLAEPATWGRQQDRLAGAVEAAAVAGAPCLVVTTGPAGPLEWDAAAEALAAALAPVGPLALAAGVRLAVENTSPLRVDLSFATTLRDTVDLADRLGTGVCVEVTSCFAERDLAATLTLAAERGLLAHVQVSDIVLPSLCTPDRAVPGDGAIPLTRIATTVLDTGYQAAFEIEMVGPRIEAEGYGPAVTRAVAWMDALLQRLAPGPRPLRG